MAVLELSGVTKRFGGLTAVSDFNIAIQEGELVGLIGPNGAGKTTVFNLITGMYAPTSGTIEFLGERVDGKKPFEIARRGIARTFQNLRLFKSLTALQNVAIARQLESRYSFFDAAFRTRAFRAEEKRVIKDSLELLELVGLGDKAYEKAKNLPYGYQRKLEIARALSLNPKLLLLDEPAAGMNPEESLSLMDFIEDIQEKFGVTIFLIEHHMEVVMGICDRIVVLNFGCTIAEGTPLEVQENEEVIKAYLGEVQNDNESNAQG
ncbi:MAG: ABC transporter ATP-binding protein [Bacillota bacterium]